MVKLLLARLFRRVYHMCLHVYHMYFLLRFEFHPHFILILVLVLRARPRWLVLGWDFILILGPLSSSSSVADCFLLLLAFLLHRIFVDWSSVLIGNVH